MASNDENQQDHRPIEDVAPDGTSPAPDPTPPQEDHRWGNPQEEGLAFAVDERASSRPPWGLTRATPVPLVAGQPPVLVGWAWTPAEDGAAPGSEVDPRLTPRLAALLVVTCTRPGDLIADAVGDPALAGAAAAGARTYRNLALDDEPGLEPAVRTGSASLVLSFWPTARTQLTQRPVSDQRGAEPPALDVGRPPTGDALVQVVAMARRQTTADGHLAILLGRTHPELDALAPRLVQAMHSTGGGHLNRAVMLIEAGRDSSGYDPTNRPLGLHGRARRPRIIGLLLVVQLSSGGGRERP
jgi:hypothetical protein